MSKGTLPISGCIVPMSDLDTYPTHWDKYQRGGMRIVANAAERDAITADRRVEGMQIYVADAKRLDQLVGGVDNTKWVNVFTLDSNNKVVLNTQLSQAKYLIAGAADPNIPNAIALGTQPDGYLINSGGNIITSTGVPSGAVALSFGRVLVGDANNKAAESKTITMSNLPIGLTDKFDASHVINKRPTDISLEYPNAQYLSDLTDGIVKLEASSGLLKIATADVDYATKTTLEVLAAQSKASADAAATSATAAATSATDSKEYAGAAAASAVTAAGFKEAAQNYAAAAGSSAVSANDSFLEASAAATLASGYAAGASDFADKAATSAAASNDRSLESKQYRDEAQGYATSAQTSLNTLLNTGLNKLPNHGDVNFQGFRAYNLADGTTSNDAVTLNQLNAVSGSYVKSVSGTTGRIKSTGGQDPVLDLLPTTITAGTYKAPIVAFDDYGRATAALDTNFTGVSGRTSISGNAPTVIFDLVDTGITAGDYTAPNVTVGKDGRISKIVSTTPINTITGTSGITANTANQATTLSLTPTGITAGDYTSPNVTVDGNGRITAITSKLPILTMTGDGNVFPFTVGGSQDWNITLKTTGVTAGTYNLMTGKVDAQGRLTSASTNTLSGTTGQITVSALPNMVVDLAKTGVTANSYSLMSATVDDRGRLSAASTNTLSGSTGRITVSSLPNMAVDLVQTALGDTLNSGVYLTYDNYGRVLTSSESYLHTISGANLASTTTVGTANTYTVLNVPLNSNHVIRGFSYGGGTNPIVYTDDRSTYKRIMVVLGLVHNGTANARTFGAIRKNGTILIAETDTVLGNNGNIIVLTAKTLCNTNDFFHIMVNQFTLTGPVQISCRSANITID